MEYLSVKDFDRFQHYKNRAPPWIKFYASLLDNYEWSCLQDASKAHLAGIWLLASKHDNQVPADPEWIGKRIGATEPVDLQPLVDQGFIEVASDVLARCKQIDPLERETERETEAEKRKEIVVAPKETALVRSANDSLELLVQRFDEVEDRSNGTKRKEEAVKLATAIVFRYWMAKMNHPRAVLDKKRQSRIAARLRENNCDVDELLYVIDGAKRDDWLMGRSDKSTKKYDGIETIFRDREQVEKLAETAPGSEKRPHPLLRANDEETNTG